MVIHDLARYACVSEKNSDKVPDKVTEKSRRVRGGLRLCSASGSYLKRSELAPKRKKHKKWILFLKIFNYSKKCVSLNLKSPGAGVDFWPTLHTDRQLLLGFHKKNPWPRRSRKGKCMTSYATAILWHYGLTSNLSILIRERPKSIFKHFCLKMWWMTVLGFLLEGKGDIS